MNVPPAKRLMREYNELQQYLAENDPQGQRFTIVDRNVVEPQETASSATSTIPPNPHLSLIVRIYPKTAPFQGRGLRVELRVPSDYPFELPEAYMQSEIRHPNVDFRSRRICSDFLNNEKSEKKTMTLLEVIQFIIHLMDEPELGHIVDAEMGSLCQRDNASYNEKIREMVNIAGEPRP